MPPVGSELTIPRWAAADLRLRPRGYWYRLNIPYYRNI